MNSLSFSFSVNAISMLHLYCYFLVIILFLHNNSVCNNIIKFISKKKKIMRCKKYLLFFSLLEMTTFAPVCHSPSWSSTGRAHRPRIRRPRPRRLPLRTPSTRLCSPRHNSRTLTPTLWAGSSRCSSSHRPAWRTRG